MRASRPAAAPAGPVADLLLRRVERALRQRARYRYVQPSVLREGEGLRIESACCSRNIAADGGIIDIALLLPIGSEPGEGGWLWRIHARDHGSQRWVARGAAAPLGPVLALLCQDPDRVFWP